MVAGTRVPVSYVQLIYRKMHSDLLLDTIIITFFLDRENFLKSFSSILECKEEKIVL